MNTTSTIDPEVDHDDNCDLGIFLPSTYSIVRASGVARGETFTNDFGDEFATLTMTDPIEVAGREPVMEPSGDVDLSPTLALLQPRLALTDPVAIDELIAEDAPVLLYIAASVGRAQFRNLVAAVGNEAPDGSIDLAGPCGATWQDAIDDTAAAHGRVADAAFFLDLAEQWGSDLGGEVGDRFNAGPDPTQLWLDTAPPDRSLDVREIPLEQRGNYTLVGVAIDLAADLPAGFVRLASDEGVIRTFATAGIEGVLPVMIPKNTTEITVQFLTAPDTEPVTVSTLFTTDFSEDTGDRLTVTATRSGSITVELTALADGELADILGISPDEIEALKESVLAST